MHLAPGLFDNLINLKYRTNTRTIDFFMRIRTHTCAMLEDHYITNNHEYKKDTSKYKIQP